MGVRALGFSLLLCCHFCGPLTLPGCLSGGIEREVPTFNDWSKVQEKLWVGRTSQRLPGWSAGVKGTFWSVFTLSTLGLSDAFPLGRQRGLFLFAVVTSPLSEVMSCLQTMADPTALILQESVLGLRHTRLPRCTPLVWGLHAQPSRWLLTAPPHQHLRGPGQTLPCTSMASAGAPSRGLMPAPTSFQCRASAQLSGSGLSDITAPSQSVSAPETGQHHTSGQPRL